jgi:hypothetical protein
MPDEPDKRGGDAEAKRSDEEAANERPTVSPPFDPVEFARDMSRPSPLGLTAANVRPGPALSSPSRPDQHSVVTARPRHDALPPEATEPSEPAPPDEARRKTPTSTLSLANARMPSNLPPIGGPKITESLSSINAVDREWADLELATRPPPADGPGEDPIIEIARNPLPLDLDEVGLEDEHSVATVRRPAPQELVKPREREMSDRVSLGDYSGALAIAEKILADNHDDAAAQACAENCRTVLRQMYATRIGPLDRVPVVMVPRDQMRWLSIDHKAGFMLSLVDGVSSLEMIIDVSGMPELDTLRILSELLQQRIISFR